MTEQKFALRSLSRSTMLASGIFRRKQQICTAHSDQRSPFITHMATATSPFKVAHKRTRAAPKHNSEGSSGEPVGHAIVNEFSRSLDRTQDEIVEDAFNSLIDAEQLLTERLYHTRATSMEKIDELGLINHSALAPFRVMGLEGWPLPDWKQSRHEDGYLAPVGELRQKLRTIERTLEKLWQEWSRIQSKILCLGAEVFGSRSLDLYSPNLPRSLNRKINRAVGRHEIQFVRSEEMRRIAEEQRGNIALITRDTLKELSVQKKTSQGNDCWDLK
uniref:Uncharacterized protein n=1 Tax=Coccidioides posadasii RMSCC 3488 TaxID=454284 RepID=A0A0J6INS0_COCPO|nr:hypothetical protein CPAG_09869 [Coccidioides posadasii RMSCC 3488]